MYHISRKYLNESIQLTPRIPASAPAYEDNKTPRICVSPTIEQCIMGIVGSDIKSALKKIDTDWYIYKTDDDNYIPAKDVFDHLETEEHWFCKKTDFKYFGKVCAKAAKRGELKFELYENNKNDFILKYK